MNHVLTSGPVWYLMRASGVVSLLLLTAVSALGVATTSRLRPGRLPRFVTLGLHRNISLLAVAFLSLHVLTAVIDPDATVRAMAVILPLPSSRYGLWLGLGALALDLIIALIVTSLLRQRLAPRIWRALHYLAYLAWPVALVHGAGIGTDSGAIWMLVVDAALRRGLRGSGRPAPPDGALAGLQASLAAPRAGRAVSIAVQPRQRVATLPRLLPPAGADASLGAHIERYGHLPAPAWRGQRAHRGGRGAAACEAVAAPAFRRTSSWRPWRPGVRPSWSRTASRASPQATRTVC